VVTGGGGGGEASGGGGESSIRVDTSNVTLTQLHGVKYDEPLTNPR
jgi:hypothetical protein